MSPSSVSHSPVLRRLVEGSVIAALYTALSLCLAPLSFGPLQIRVAEALTLLPVYTPAAVAGLTLGCALTNGIGLAMGANIAGAWDILFGTLATLLAAVLTRRLGRITWRNLPLAAALPPVVINGVVVGLELTLTAFAGFSWPTFALCAGQIMAGQLVACGGGLFLCRALSRLPLFR